MKKSELINQVIVKSGLAKTVPEAYKIFVLTFVEYFSNYNLRTWDTEVLQSVAETFLHDLGDGRGISVRYLIKDIDRLGR